MSPMPNKLYLIPNTISDETTVNILPAYLSPTIAHLRFFAVEEEKAARRLLKKINGQFPLDQAVLVKLNEHTKPRDVEKIFQEAGNQDIGIISEAGCPGVADPGSELVLLAHQKNWEVVPLVGPSAILLALMASGLTGQNFCFHGYLPKEKDLRIRKIKTLEKRSVLERQTQIFVETPYRNENILEDVLSCCEADTLLCVACDLSAPTQFIKTLPIKEWRSQKISLHKRPVVFLLGKSGSTRGA